MKWGGGILVFYSWLPIRNNSKEDSYHLWLSPGEEYGSDWNKKWNNSETVFLGLKKNEVYSTAFQFLCIYSTW